MLEEDDTLATEAASEEDQDGTGLEGLADLSRADRLANLLCTEKSVCQSLVVCCVSAENGSQQFDHFSQSFKACWVRSDAMRFQSFLWCVPMRLECEKISL